MAISGAIKNSFIVIDDVVYRNSEKDVDYEIIDFIDSELSEWDGYIHSQMPTIDGGMFHSEIAISKSKLFKLKDYIGSHASAIQFDDEKSFNTLKEEHALRKLKPTKKLHQLAFDSEELMPTKLDFF